MSANDRNVTTEHLLENIMWHSLHGAQSQHAVGTNQARRYAPGFSPIAGFAEPEQPDFEALRRFCSPGEPVYCSGWSGPAPAGWLIEAQTTLFQMVWEADPPPTDGAPDAVPLGPEHAAQALALANLTRPGPFGPRTLELGDYFGFLDGERLVAMAGERMHAGALREISGVCTHPDFQGRGLAQRLMLKLIHRQMQRGETPFLHVMRENAGARALYERMGFKTHREAIVRIVSPAALR